MITVDDVLLLFSWIKTERLHIGFQLCQLLQHKFKRYWQGRGAIMEDLGARKWMGVGQVVDQLWWGVHQGHYLLGIDKCKH